MSTRKQRDGGKERFWRRMVRQWGNSRLSIRAFCLGHGLSEPNFYAWRRLLKQRDAAACAFVPVQVVADNKPVERPAATTSGTVGGLELVVGGGRLLRIGPGFDAATLLPDDVATLKHMIVELVELLQHERQDRAALQHRLELLLRRLYGPRTEHFSAEKGTQLFLHPFCGKKSCVPNGTCAVGELA